MRVATLIVATALGLGTCVTTAPAAVISGGHAGGTQFGHGGFDHPFHRRFHKTVVFPYGYYDNDYPTDPFGDDAATTYSPLSCRQSRRRLHASATWRHLPSPQAPGAPGKSRS